MKKIFNKFTKILLLIAMIFSDLMTPIKVLADETNTTTPQKGDVGINETVSNEGSVSVTKGSLANPGDVQVTKTVKKNGEGKFTVEFDVKGKDVESTSSVVKPVYAVVVFDRSTSMRETTDECVHYSSFFGIPICDEYKEIKFSAAVEGAKTFASSLLEKIPNAQIGLVTFSSSASVAKDFNSTLNNDLSDANFGSPSGGTNLHAGLIEANNLLSDSSVPANAKKYVVIISDGEPTYYVNENGGTAGPGSKTDEDVYNNTISMADTIKEYAEVFSIGYSLPTEEVYNGMTAADILKNMATEDDTSEEDYITHYYDSDPEEVAAAFSDIATSISKSPAGTEATITDNIGSSFSVDANSSNLITVTGSSVSNTDKFDITEEGTKISFDVEINGDEADGWVNVNEGFTLTYTDANGESKTITYGSDEPQPEVYWERNTYNYVINYYKDEKTNPDDTVHYLGSSDVLSAFNGQEITLTDAEKNAFLSNAGEGYELSDSNVYTITIDKTKDNNIIDVLYEKKDLNYITKYFFEENNTYTENTSLRESTNPCKYGDEVNALEKSPSSIPTGYVLDETKTKAETANNDGKYIITENDAEVKVYYKKQEFTYAVDYYFQDLNGNYATGLVAGLTNQPAKYGDEVSYSDHTLATIPEGYVLDVNQSKTEGNNGTYTITDNSTIVKVYYKRSNYSFTVNYHFNGTKFDEVYTADAVYGSTLYANNYIVEKIDNTKIKNKYNEDKYFLDPNKNNENNASIEVGTINEDNVMNLYYISTFFEENAEEITKSSNTREVTSSNQVVDYTITYENTIKNVRKGDVITVTVVDTLPFEIDTNNNNTDINAKDPEGNVIAEGVYDNSNKTITWTFTDTATAYTETYDIEKTISFKVVYKDFADISADENNNKLVNTATGKTDINGDSTDGTTSDTEEIPVKIEGNLVVRHYEKNTTTEVADKEEYTGLVGASYADKTNYKTDIIGYTYDSVTGDENGNYIEGTKEVIYYYVRKDGEIVIDEDATNKIAEKEEVDSINSTFEYTINAVATIKDYVGYYTVEATDNLPYELDTTGMEEINGKYKVNDKCIYDGNNKTITCTSAKKEITAEDYDENREYHVNESFSLNIKYLNIKEKTITNNATIKVILDNNNKTSEEDSADVTIKEGNLTVIYKSGNTEFEKTTTTALAGTPYTTEEKSFFGYHLTSEPNNAKGEYLGNQTITVIYEYVLNDGEITKNEVTKVGPEVIEDVNDFVEYTITYTGEVKDYIGKATLTVTDTLPYQMVYAGYDSRCEYDGDKTFTCTVEYDITEEDYVDGVFTINEEFYLDAIFGEIDSTNITNKVDAKLELTNVYKDTADSATSEVLEGEILVNYVDEEGNVIDSYTETNFAGFEYSTEKKEFDGYTFSKSTNNTEGVYLANTTIYIEYVYSKNIGTYEELPPFTGFEDINVSYIKYLIAAFVFFLLDKKNKEAKNN